MDRRHWMTPADAAARVGAGSRVFVSGCLGEPGPILDAVAQTPEIWRNVRLTGALVPGVNRRDYAGLGLDTVVETVFAHKAEGKGGAGHRVDILPFHYSSYWRWLARPGTVDVAFFNVTRPRRDGTVGLGPSVDFAPAVLEAGAAAYGVVNSRLPDVVDGPRIPVERLRGLVEGECALPGYDPGPGDAVTRRIAELVVSVLPERCTLQLGLGRSQAAILEAICGLKDLGFRGGMISPPILRALDAGVFPHGVTTGVALGHADFLEAVARRPDVAFRPVRETHGAALLAAIDRFVAVNSALSVDLFGQANVEFTGGRRVSGLGGLGDFLRGASLSNGGRSLFVLPATARGGSLSRIVPALASPVSVARADVDMVVTEHGIADLRHAGMEERAARLIAVAAPGFRGDLAGAWERMREGND